MLSSFVVSIADQGVLEAKDTLAAKIVRMEDEIQDLTKRAEAALEADDEAAARAFLEKKWLGGGAWLEMLGALFQPQFCFSMVPDVFFGFVTYLVECQNVSKQCANDIFWFEPAKQVPFAAIPRDRHEQTQGLDWSESVVIPAGTLAIRRFVI